MTLGIWMSDGWEVSASTGEEVDDDASATGRGGITGLLITTVVLVACMWRSCTSARRKALPTTRPTRWHT